MSYDSRGSIKHARRDSGFTMFELMVAVLIIAILLAVGIISLQQRQKRLKQIELDTTARTIFIAAQNHLALAQSQGILVDMQSAAAKQAEAAGDDDDAADAVGYMHTAQSADDDGAESGASEYVLRYLFHVPGGSIDKGTVLYEMLPDLSLDARVRDSGSYVIEYNLDTARVVSVFYSDQSTLSTAQFTEADDYKPLFLDPSYYGDNKEANRLEYKRQSSGDGTIIGWYGGDDIAGLQMKKLYAPKIQLINAERLEVKISFENLSTTQKQQNSAVEGAQLHLYVLGNTSKHLREIKSWELATVIANPDTIGPIILDDITTEDQQFSKKWCTIGVNGTTADNQLIPGENITVYAEVSTTETFAMPVKSSQKHSNSLFETVQVHSGKNEAVISNIRHLENLDTTISGYDTSKFEITDDGGATVSDAIARAVQAGDLQWSGASGANGSRVFCKRIASMKTDEGGSDVDQDDIRIYKLDGSATESGTFCPVDLSYLQSFTYDGDTHAITMLKVDTASDAGLFSTLGPDATVKNLELIDCEVKTTGNNAGMLVGSIAAESGTTIVENVVVRDRNDGKQSKVINSASGGVAGGLIGKIESAGTGDTTEIIACGSSALVNATGTNSVAGGLVGTTAQGVTVSYSYSAGHTVGGVYKDETEADCSITADAKAGGLIGSENESSIVNCYSTCSVATTSDGADRITGGLVGEAVGGSIVGSYATGRVLGALITDENEEPSTGAFIGSIDSETSLKDESVSVLDNYYFEIINYDDVTKDGKTEKGYMTAVGGSIQPEGESVKQIDKDASSYNAFCWGLRSDKRTDETNAKPYDDTLTDNYNDWYAFISVAQLESAVNPDEEDIIIKSEYYVNTHYGDWPSPEIMVINEVNPSAIP